MSLAVLNTSVGAIEVIAASLFLPLIGAPLYYLDLDADEAPAGRCELAFATGPSFVGTVARATPFEGRVEVVMVGGAGGLGLEPELAVEVGGAGYTGTPIVVDAELVVGDILKLTGEGISPSAVETLAGLSLPRWHRVAGLAAHALGYLAQAWGVSWRILPDGTVWLGAETWPEHLDADNAIVQADCADTSSLVAALDVDRPDILPGQSLVGRRVERVVYSLTDTSLRAEVTYQAKEGVSPISGALRAAVGPSATVYASAHVCRVVQQRDDDTLDLLADTAALGSTGINRVPIRLGLATARQILEVNASVVLRFASSSTFPLGDPRLPYAEAFPSDVDADRPIARRGDRVKVATISYTAGLSPDIDPKPLINTIIQLHASPYGGPDPAPIVISFHGVVLSGWPPAVPLPVYAWIDTGSPEVMLRRLDTEVIP